MHLQYQHHMAASFHFFLNTNLDIDFSSDFFFKRMFPALYLYILICFLTSIEDRLLTG